MNSAARTALAVRLDIRDVLRRPVILVLLALTPYVFISRALSNTEPLPKTFRLANGQLLTTTMRDLHGADMTVIAVAFLAGLVGVFVMNAARQADARLVRAGYRRYEIIAGRVAVLIVCTLVITAVALLTTARDFSPHDWTWFAAGNVAIGLTYSGLGALASVSFGRIGATYFLLFAAMLDLGVIQNPMFASSPPAWAAVLPGYAATRVVMTGALSNAGVPALTLVAMAAWLLGVSAFTYWRLSATLGSS